MTARAAPHDYEYLSEGKVIPHGIYDLHANEGYISLGDSSETADFITDNRVGGPVTVVVDSIWHPSLS